MDDWHARAEAWDAANPERARELSDAMDACSGLLERRALYATLSEDEKNGITVEMYRREVDRKALPGDIAVPKNQWVTLVQRNAYRTMSASTDGLIFVLGSPCHGSSWRYVTVHPPWRDREGNVISYAEVNVNDLEVIR